MGDLSQAQVVGGAVVTIGADTRGLRAGWADAKATTAAVDAMKATVKVAATIDKPAVAAAAAAAVAAVKAVAATAAIAIPVMLDLRPAMAQLEHFRRQIAVSPITVSVVPPPSLPGGSSLGPRGGGGGSRRRTWDYEGEYTVREPLRLPGSVRPEPYAQGGRSNYQGEGIGPQTADGARSAASRFAGGLKDVGRKLGKAADDLSSLNGQAFEKIVKFGIAAKIAGTATGFARDAIEQGPRAATKGLVETADNFFTGGSGQNLLAIQRSAKKSAWGSGLLAAGGLGTSGLGDEIVSATNAVGLTSTMTAADEPALERQQRSAAAKMARTEQVGTASTGFNRYAQATNEQGSVAKLSEQDRAVAAAMKERRDVAAQVESQRMASNPAAKAALAAADAKIADKLREQRATNQYEDDTGRSDRVGIYAGMAANRARASGQTDRAGRMDIEEGTRSQVDALEAERRKLVSSGDRSGKVPQIAQKIAALKLAGSEALVAYDEQIKRERDDVITSAKSTAKQTRLRSAGNVVAADEEATREGFRAPLAAARRNNDTATVSALEDSMQAQLDAQNKQRAFSTEQAIAQADAQGNAARLRMRGEGNKAELALFDANLKAHLDSLRAGGQDQRVIDAEARAAAARRGELVLQQNMGSTSVADGYRTRRDVAGAQALGQGTLASVIGQLAQAKEERTAAASTKDAGQRVDLAKTQIAELESARTQMFAPNRYAQQMDRNRVAIGGANDQAGRGELEALKLLSKTLTELTEFVKANGGKGLST